MRATAPLHQQIVVASGGATAGTVAEGTPKAIAKLQFSVNQITENKTICIVAVTKELLRISRQRTICSGTDATVASATESPWGKAGVMKAMRTRRDPRHQYRNPGIHPMDSAQPPSIA